MAKKEARAVGTSFVHQKARLDLPDSGVGSEIGGREERAQTEREHAYGAVFDG